MRPAAEWNPSCFLLLFGISDLSQLPYRDPYLSFFEREGDVRNCWLGILRDDTPSLDFSEISSHTDVSQDESAIKKLLYGSGTIDDGHPAGRIGREKR